MTDGSVKALVAIAKTIGKDTGWRSGRITPVNHGRLWTRSLELPNGWTWRSLSLNDGALICLFRVNESFAKFQAMLIEPAGQSGRLIARCEHYPGKDAGLHVHTHCPDAPDELGPATISAPLRLPAHNARHRRSTPISRDEFFVVACHLFRIDSTETRQLALGMDA